MFPSPLRDFYLSKEDKVCMLYDLLVQSKFNHNVKRESNTKGQFIWSKFNHNVKRESNTVGQL